MRSHSIWMPIYWADYFADTLQLTTEQNGAYLMLIGAYWRRGGPLPDDDKFLAMIVRAGAKRWRSLRSAVAPYFVLEDGLWKHKRLDFELLRSSDRSAAGVRANSVRWSDRTPSHSHSHSHSHKKESKKEGASRPARKKKIFPMPEDWKPNEGHFALATQLGVGIEVTLSRMRDYCASTGKQYADYDAAFRTFLRNAKKFEGKGNGSNWDDSHSASKAAGRLAEMARRGEFKFSPRPSLLPGSSADVVGMLPKK